uniref:Uncharacterized protein n=1 Tax=viral metagenome TaxID=1070528 RepID=A0A6C0IXC6_9ZZZZ
MELEFLFGFALLITGAIVYRYLSRPPVVKKKKHRRH